MDMGKPILACLLITGSFCACSRDLVLDTRSESRDSPEEWVRGDGFNGYSGFYPRVKDCFREDMEDIVASRKLAHYHEIKELKLIAQKKVYLRGQNYTLNLYEGHVALLRSMDIVAGFIEYEQYQSILENLIH